MRQACGNVGAGCLGTPERVGEALGALSKVAEEVLGRTEERASATKARSHRPGRAEAILRALINPSAA